MWIIYMTVGREKSSISLMIRSRETHTSLANRSTLVRGKQSGGINFVSQQLARSFLLVAHKKKERKEYLPEAERMTVSEEWV